MFRLHILRRTLTRQVPWTVSVQAGGSRAVHSSNLQTVSTQFQWHRPLLLTMGLILGGTLGSQYSFSTVYAKQEAIEGKEEMLKDAKLAPEGDSKEGKGFKDRTIIAYENRIRNYSNPDKIFRYFATLSVDGTVYMTVDDFVRSLTPGDIQPQKYGLDLYKHISQEEMQRRAAKAETSGNFFESGLFIPFSEYMFLLSIMQTPNRKFEIAFKMFDLDGNGTLDAKEFMSAMSVIRDQSCTGKYYNSQSPAARKESSKASALLIALFGENRRKKLTFAEFKEFAESFRRELFRREFERFSKQMDRKTISAEDFARLLFQYSPRKFCAKYIARAKELDQIITLDDYTGLSNFLQSFDDIDAALGMYHQAGETIDRTDFSRAASAVADAKLSDNLVDFIFHVFDTDGDGELAYDEFVSIMKQRKDRGMSKVRSMEVTRGFKALAICIRQQIMNPDPDD
eukprot:Clim_evm9s146 gene=Clim_evmTU9s146